MIESTDGKQKFVFYETFYETALPLLEGSPQEREIGIAYMKAVMEYGLYGEFDDSNIIVKSLMQQTTFAIAEAQKRYKESQENGGKGGRPKSVDEEQIMALLREGKKNVEIAAIVGCSDKTVSRIKKKMSSEPPSSSGTGTGFVF